MYRKWILPTALFIAIATIISFCFYSQEPKKQDEVMVITMPENDLIRDIDMNYYTTWLEEKSGLDLVFNFIPETYGADYLEKVLTKSNIKTDIVFDFKDVENTIFTYERVEELGREGHIIPLNKFIDESTNFDKIVKMFYDYDLRAYMTSNDGNLYFFPNIDVSAKARWGHSLWINVDWLRILDMHLPQTTEELEIVLQAFCERDPNGNNIADELSLGGNETVDYIINSFVYNDPANMRLFVEDGKVLFAPTTNRWREAMIYLNGLYNKGLISRFALSLCGRNLIETATSPDNVLGGFTSKNIAEVVHPTCTDIINNFTSLAPIKGPNGVANSVVKTPIPQVGAVISSDCKNPSKAFELLDLMLSEEAFLIARYGQEDVDWKRVSGVDLDSYGDKSVIKVLHQFGNNPQNKHYAGIGPMYHYPEYADHVTWTGFDAELLNSRAYLTHLEYQPKEPIGLIAFKGEEQETLLNLRNEIEQYVNQEMREFIIGEKNINDDGVWQEYIQGFENKKLDELIYFAQLEYQKNIEWRENTYEKNTYTTLD